MVYDPSYVAVIR